MSERAGGVQAKVWDGPVRIVHWLLVVLIGFSWWASEDHLNWHRWSGYAVIGLVLFRIYWGFAGGGAARFSSFVKGPKAIAAYASQVTRRDVAVTPGHNPLGALSVLIGYVALGSGNMRFANELNQSCLGCVLFKRGVREAGTIGLRYMLDRFSHHCVARTRG